MTTPLHRCVVVVVATIALQGCAAPRVSPETLLDLAPGATQPQVHRAFKTSGEHVFTAAISGAVVSGERYCFYPSGEDVYLIYQDGSLSKIVKPPRYPMRRIPYERGGWTLAPEPFDPEQRLQHTLTLPPMAGEEIRDLIERVEESKRRRREGSEPNVLPAAVINAPLTAPAMVAAAPFSVIGSAVDVQRAKQPWRIEIGMHASQVDALLGKPLLVMEGRESRIYGKKSEFENPDAESAESLIEVRFANGSASRVYSHAFFNPGIKLANALDADQENK